MSLEASRIGAMNDGDEWAAEHFSASSTACQASTRRSIRMSEVPENPGRELKRQHPSLAQPAGSAAAAIQPGAQPDAGVAEHGLRGRVGQPALAASATRTPADATRSFNFAQEQLYEPRQRRGSGLEGWWQERLGHAFDCLTKSKARYLARTADADTVRDRFAKAQQGGSSPGCSGNPGRRLSTRDLTDPSTPIGGDLR